MSRELKVLILVTSLNRGGIETVLLNYVRELSKRRLLTPDNTIVDSESEDADKMKLQIDFLVNRSEIGDYEPELERLGCKIYRMGAMYPWRFSLYKHEFAQFLKARNSDISYYDIIHSHLEERSYFPLLVASQKYAYLPEKQHPKLIAQSHNAYTLSLIDPKSYFRRWFRKRLQKLAKNYKIDKVAVSNISSKWLFGESEIKNQVVTILHNPINLTGLRFDETVRQQMRSELKITEETIVFGIIGRLTYQKNQHFILEICAKLKQKRPNLDFKILLVGNGELQSEIKLQALKFGLEGHVILTGNVSNPYDYMQAMDLFLFPSRFEGLGNVVIEAQGAGLPVLASDKVPCEVNLTNNVTFLPIDHCHIWVEQIIKMLDLGISRDNSGYNTVANSPYAVSGATDELLKFYKNMG